MQLFGSVILVAACLASTYGSWIDGEAACSIAYQQAQQATNQQVSIQTSACLQSNSNVNENDPQIQVQVAIIRANIMTLQNNLANCTSITDNLQFVTCIHDDNNVNQPLWNNANNVAQNIQQQLSQQQQTGSQKNCFAHVMGNAKQNLTNAANTYKKCLQTLLNSEENNF